MFILFERVSTSPPQLISLMALIKRFPRLSPTVIKTYLELLLVAEVSLIHGKPRAVNVAAFFPTWVRGALKKGAFKVWCYTRGRGMLSW